jgi:hypothetical protein
MVARVGRPCNAYLAGVDILSLSTPAEHGPLQIIGLIAAASVDAPRAESGDLPL